MARALAWPFAISPDMTARGWDVETDSSASGAQAPRGRSRTPRGHPSAARVRRSQSRSSSRGSASSCDDGRVDMKAGPGGALRQPPPRPAPVGGAEWWQQPLLNAIEGERARRPMKQSRPLICESIFSGMLTEGFVDKALGIESTIVAAADKKTAARKFMLRNHLGLPHLYADAATMTSRDRTSAKCFKCITARCTAPMAGEIDLLRMAPPCQPYSTLRVKNQSGNQGTPREHKHWSTCFELAISYLDNIRPAGFICEEVMSFGERDPMTGKPYVILFQEKAQALDYATICCEQQASDWGAFSRPRLYVVGVGKSLGHWRAAQWVGNMIDEILQHRRMAPAAPLFPDGEVFGCLDTDEDSKHRRKQAQARCRVCTRPLIRGTSPP